METVNEKFLTHNGFAESICIPRLYTFVRIKRKNTSDYGTWYLKPKSIDDINDHWKTVCKSVIRDGIHDYINSYKIDVDGTVLKRHTTNHFANAVELNARMQGGTFLENALKMENLAYKTRVESFGKNDIYLPESMVVFCMPDSCEIVETIEKGVLEYPTKNAWTMEDVRYMQWGMEVIGVKGEHWYAKVGSMDIVDEHGNMKWNTKADAENAAERFINKRNNKQD